MTFTNPYASLDEDALSRVAIWAATSDIRAIRAVFPRQGLWQTSIALYVQSIANELRANNITTWSPESEAFVRAIVTRRCANSSVVEATAIDNVNRGTTEVHSPNKVDGGLPTDPQRGTPGRKREGEKGKRIDKRKGTGK